MNEEKRNLAQLRSGFEVYYQTILQPKFAGMEATRKKYLRYFAWGMGIIFGIIPLVCLGLLWLFISGGGSIDYHGEGMDYFFFGLLITIAIASSPMVIYRRISKTKVMPEFIKYFGDFHYEYQHHISDETLMKSKLFNDYNRHSGDDFFTGNYNDVEMMVSEENLTYHSTDHKGNGSNSRIFKGIVVLLEMNKNFNGQTIVFKDWGIFNSFHKIRNLGSGLQRIILEDCIFEKEFEVYGVDQLEARYLLTTAFMERMLKVRDAYKSNKIQFSFFDNKLLIAINTTKDMFEAGSLFKSATDRKMINETFEQIASIMEIIDILKLDKRLGM